jgi:hypothetical protein
VFAVLIHAAPLLGIPIWLLELSLPSNSWNFPLLFSAGLFMLGAGLLIPAAALLFVRRDFVRIHALQALKFQGWIAIALAVLAIPLAIGLQAKSTAIFTLGAIVVGFVLPVVELIRAILSGATAWRNGRP